MDKYVIVKLEKKEYAKSYDDIKEDKYLCKFVLQFSPYPSKAWTPYLENAIKFLNKEDAKAIIDILKINTPYPLQMHVINDR